MKLPTLKIGNITVPYPIIQGGMAVRISTSRLAAAVANEGGIGIIAGTAMSVTELKNEIAQARKMITGRGALGVNILFAVSQFADLVKNAMASGIDMLVSGAGFSRDMFAWGRTYGVAVVPIVSSVRLAKLAESLGAAAVVVEGKEAGGHLGTDRSVKEILPEICKSVKIPVIAAGGIINGGDIRHFLEKGAHGVQMGTRFAASKESNGSNNFKQAYIKAKPSHSIIIESPVGLPARGIRSSFSRRILADSVIDVPLCSNCLKRCSRAFCIREALEKAQEGDMDNGLVFAGERVGEINDVLSTSDIFKNLIREFTLAKK